jgi:lysozyme family protein
MNFDDAFSRLLGNEGGYTNNPADPGGETKWGISKRSYPDVDIVNLTQEGAKAIYLRDFWNPLGEAHPAVKFQCFDFAVNSGMQTAIRKLQAAIGVADDGQWGPVSAVKLASMPVDKVLMKFVAQRIRFWTALSTWDKFGRGWANRAATDLDFASEDI